MIIENLETAMKVKHEDDQQRVMQPKELGRNGRIIFNTLWLIICPVLALFPVMGFFIGGLYVAELIHGEPNSGEIFTSGLQIATFVSVLLSVLVMQLGKKLLKNREHLFLRSGAKILSFYIWVGIIVGGIATIGIGYRPVTLNQSEEQKAERAQSSKQEAQLMQVVGIIGGDPTKLSNVSVLYADGYKDGIDGQSGEYVPYNNQHGDFSYGEITVKRGLDVETEKIIVAHEYLHHIWETQIDPVTIHDLTSQLTTLYGKDDDFQSRTKIYSDTNMLLPSELFAYYCTESSDQYLSQYILSQCNTYINRSVLQFTR